MNSCREDFFSKKKKKSTKFENGKNALVFSISCVSNESEVEIMKEDTARTSWKTWFMVFSTVLETKIWFYNRFWPWKSHSKLQLALHNRWLNVNLDNLEIIVAESIPSQGI